VIFLNQEINYGETNVKKKKKKTYEKVKTKKFTELITGRKIDRILNCFNEKLDRIKREVQKRTQYLEKDFFNYIRKIMVIYNKFINFIT